MSWKGSKISAVSAEPAAVTPLSCECKVFASNDFLELMDGLVAVHVATLIHEQPAVY